MNAVTTLPLVLRFIRKFNFPRKLGILERIFGRQLSKLGTCWVKCSNGVLWKLDLDDHCHRWIVYGKYEGGYGIDLAASMLKEGGVYVDSGANIGQWLLYLGHIKGLKAHAFEPVSSQRAWLNECLSKQQWHVNVFDFGLGSESTELDIQVNGARSTLQMDWYQGENFKLEKISIKKLEDVLESQSIDSVDFWKLDTEGAELEALLGAKKYLQQGRIKCVYFECHPSNYKAIIALFTVHNYAVYDLFEGKLLPKTEKNISGTIDLVAMPL